jgi:hypothetical protein
MVIQSLALIEIAVVHDKASVGGENYKRDPKQQSSQGKAKR